MPGAPKHHHFVPVFLIRRFVDANDLVWLYDKEALHKGFVARNPKKVLYEDHLYTTTDNRGVRDVRMEGVYSRMEHDAALIISKIIREIRADRLPNLESAEKIVWDIFLYEQFRRVPDFRTTLDSDEEVMDAAIADAIDQYERRTGTEVSDDERRSLAEPSSKARLQQNAHIGALRRPSIAVLTVLSSRGLAFARTRGPQKSFVLGSRPVLKLTPPGVTELGDHRVELWLPVAPDIAVGVGHDRGTEILVQIPDAALRQHNLATIRQSSKVIASSPRLLHSLVTNR